MSIDGSKESAWTDGSESDEYHSASEDILRATKSPTHTVPLLAEDVPESFVVKENGIVELAYKSGAPRGLIVELAAELRLKCENCSNCERREERTVLCQEHVLLAGKLLVQRNDGNRCVYKIEREKYPSNAYKVDIYRGGVYLASAYIGHGNALEAEFRGQLNSCDQCEGVGEYIRSCVRHCIPLGSALYQAAPWSVQRVHFGSELREIRYDFGF